MTNVLQDLYCQGHPGTVVQSNAEQLLLLLETQQSLQGLSMLDGRECVTWNCVRVI